MNQILAALSRDIGNQRDTMEDYAAFEELTTKGGLSLKVGIVCDGTSLGLGGYHGSRAAHMTAETVLNAFYTSQHPTVPAAILSAVQAANEYVFDNEKGKATLALFAIHTYGSEARLYIASMGNSIIGLVREGKFIRLNVDHTVAAENILLGKMDVHTAYQHTKAHYLTRIIGMNREIQVDMGFYHENITDAQKLGEQGVALKNGDVVYAFTDGLLQMDEHGIPFFHDQDFIYAAQKSHIDEAAQDIIRKSLSRGAEDNLALVMARCERINRVLETHILVPDEIQAIRQQYAEQKRQLIEPDKPAPARVTQETPLPALFPPEKHEFVMGIQPLFGNPYQTGSYDSDILVIMPPDKNFCTIYDEHVQSVAQRLDCTIHRSDDLFTDNAIIQDIWSSIYTSRLVIADCTGRNPNVFYELGIAHTLGRAVVLVTQNMIDIPFDVRDRRFLQYDGDLSYASMMKFQNKLEVVMTGFLKSRNMPPPPSGRIEAVPIFGKPATNRQYNANIFMMMPFTSLMRDIYEDHILAVAQDLKMSITVGDDFFTQHAIMQDIWSAVYHAELIIADCTGRNPNVFYELGIAHTIGKPVILITQQDEDVPTDLRHLRYIQYTYTPRGMKQFEEKLSEAILKITEKV